MEKLSLQIIQDQKYHDKKIIYKLTSTRTDQARTARSCQASATHERHESAAINKQNINRKSTNPISNISTSTTTRITGQSTGHNRKSIQLHINKNYQNQEQQSASPRPLEKCSPQFTKNQQHPDKEKGSYKTNKHDNRTRKRHATPLSSSTTSMRRKRSI